MAISRRPWSSEDDALLREQYKPGGGCGPRIAALLGRTPAAIWQRACKLGLAGRGPHRKPVPADVLHSVVREECKRAPGVTLALVLAGSRLHRVAWVRARVCRRLYRSGYSYPAIGEALGLDHWSAGHAARRPDLDQLPKGFVNPPSETPRRNRLVRLSTAWQQQQEGVRV